MQAANFKAAVAGCHHIQINIGSDASESPETHESSGTGQARYLSAIHPMRMRMTAEEAEKAQKTNTASCHLDSKMWSVYCKVGR